MTTRCWAVFYQSNKVPLTFSGVNTSIASHSDFFPFGGSAKTPNFFPIDSVSTEVDQTLSITPTGSGAGRVAFGAVTLTRAIDDTDLTFLTFCAKGTEFRWVDVVWQRKPVNGTKYLTYAGYRFGKAAIAHIAPAGNETTSETITLDYGELSIGYAVDNGAGGVSAPVIAGWSSVTNSAL